MATGQEYGIIKCSEITYKTTSQAPVISEVDQTSGWKLSCVPFSFQASLHRTLAIAAGPDLRVSDRPSLLPSFGGEENTY